ncbi:MAG: hypothetical protein DRM99_03970, partial [Thermoplasmata archaeon]
PSSDSSKSSFSSSPPHISKLTDEQMKETFVKTMSKSPTFKTLMIEHAKKQKTEPLPQPTQAKIVKNPSETVEITDEDITKRVTDIVASSTLTKPITARPDQRFLVTWEKDGKTVTVNAPASSIANWDKKYGSRIVKITTLGGETLYQAPTSEEINKIYSETLKQEYLKTGYIPEFFKEQITVPEQVRELDWQTPGVNLQEEYVKRSYEEYLGLKTELKDLPSGVMGPPEPVYRGSEAFERLLKGSTLENPTWVKQYGKFKVGDETKTYQQLYKEYGPALSLKYEPEKGYVPYLDVVGYQKKYYSDDNLLKKIELGAFKYTYSMANPEFYSKLLTGGLGKAEEYMLEQEYYAKEGIRKGKGLETWAGIQAPYYENVVIPYVLTFGMGAAFGTLGKIGTGAIEVTGVGSKVVPPVSKVFTKAAGGILLTTFAVGTGANIYKSFSESTEKGITESIRTGIQTASAIGGFKAGEAFIGEKLSKTVKDEFGEWVLLPDEHGKMRPVKTGAMNIKSNIKLTGREFTPEQVGIKIKTVVGEPANVKIKGFTFTSSAKSYTVKGEPYISRGRGWVLTTDKPTYIVYGGKEFPLTEKTAFVYGQASTPLYETRVNPLAEIQSSARKFFKVTGKTDFNKYITKQIGVSLSEFSGVGKFESFGKESFVFKTHGLSYESKQLLFGRGGISEKPVDVLTRSSTRGAGRFEKGVFVEKTPEGYKLYTGRLEKTFGFGVSENVYEKNLLLVRGKTISSEKLVGGEPFKRFSFSSSHSIKFKTMLENIVGQNAIVNTAKIVGEPVTSISESFVSSGAVAIGGAGSLATRISLRKLEELESGISMSSGYWKQPSIKQPQMTGIGSDIDLLNLQRSTTVSEEKVSGEVGNIPVSTNIFDTLSESRKETIVSTVPAVQSFSLSLTGQTQRIGQKLGSALRQEMFLGNDELLVTITPDVTTPPTPPPSVPFILRFEEEKKKKPKTVVKEKRYKSYDVFVKNKKDSKNFFRVNKKPLTREDALSMGATIVDETTSAVFKIKPSKGKPSKPSIRAKPFPRLRKKFYEERPNTFVEKKTHRVDTIGEQLGVSAREWLGGRKPLKLFKKKKQKNEFKHLSRRLI